MKNITHRLFGGPPEAWGPWARAQRAHWIRRPCPR